MNQSISLSRKLTIKYLLFQALFWMSFSSIWAYAAVYLQEHQFNNTQIGIILSGSAIFSVIFQIWISNYIDTHVKVSIKTVITGLVSILIALSFLLWILPFQLFVVGLLYLSIGAIILSLPALSYSFIMDYINLGILVNFGAARATGSLSFAIMAYILGIALTNISSAIIVPIFMILNIAILFIVLSIQEPSYYSNNPLTSKISSVSQQPANLLTFFTQYKKFTLLLLGFMCLFIGHNLINTYHINIIKHVGGNDANMGLSVAIAGLTEVPTMIAFNYLITKHKYSHLLKISAIFFVLKILLITVAPNVSLIYISQFMQIAAFALFTPASVYYVNNTIDESNKVKGQALLGAATMGAGGTLGNFIGGRILDTSSVTFMLIVGVVISIIGCVISLFSIENKENKEV